MRVESIRVKDFQQQQLVARMTSLIRGHRAHGRTIHQRTIAQLVGVSASELSAFKAAGVCSHIHQVKIDRLFQRLPDVLQMLKQLIIVFFSSCSPFPARRD